MRRNGVGLVLVLLSAACGSSSSSSSGTDAAATDASSSSTVGEGGSASEGDSGSGAGEGDTAGGSTGEDGTSTGAGEDLPGFQPGTEVDIDTGTIVGERDGDLRVFRGVPFAEPPQGALRFAPPQPVAPWAGVLDATEYGPSCPQPAVPLLDGFMSGSGVQSEDCLNLNVWAYDDDTPRPVMVFIHGGAFVTGTGSAPQYEGVELARRGDVVVVTVNYRLGALGYLATEALAEESAEDSAGNYGLRDQMLALDWVRRNIAVFGGDPDNVTIFGESAGGISVCALMGAPGADGLYDKAIMQSAVGCHAFAEERVDGYAGPGAIPFGEQTAADLGCPAGPGQLSCLRNLPVEDFVDAGELVALLFADSSEKALAYSPNVDGVVLPAQPLERMSSGASGVPVVTGMNADESTLFFGAVPVVTRSDVRAQLVSLVGEAIVDDVMDVYPIVEFPLPRDVLLTAVTDLMFSCPNLAVAEGARQGANAYVYEFQRVYPGYVGLGSFHALELAYVFGTFEAFGMLPSSIDDGVSEDLQRAWTTFARTGAPTSVANWIPYGPAGDTIATFGNSPGRVSEDAFRAGRCQELRALGATP